MLRRTLPKNYLLYLFRVLYAGLAEAFEQLTTLQGLADSLANDISLLQADLSTAQSDIATAQSDITTIQGIISSIQNDLSSALSDITTLQGDIVTLQDQVSSLQTDVSTLEIDVSALQLNVTALQDDVSALTSDVSALQTDVGLLEANVSHLSGIVSSLQTDVSTLQTTLSLLSDKADELERTYEIISATYGIDLSGISVHPSITGVLRSFSEPFDVHAFESPRTIIIHQSYWNLTSQFCAGKRVKLYDASDNIFFATVASSQWSVYPSGGGSNHTHVTFDVDIPFTPVTALYERTFEAEFSEYLKRDGSVLMSFLSDSFDTSMIGEDDFCYLNASYGDITSLFPDGSKIVLFGITTQAAKVYKELVIASTSFDNWGGMLGMDHTRLNFTEYITPIHQVQTLTRISDFVPSLDQHIATKKYVDTSIIILTKSSSGNQNVGGANGTEVFWSWNGQDRIDSNFEHSVTTNPEQIKVLSAGWYRIRFLGNVQTTGSARATLHGIFRINGGSTQRKGTIRSYTRGAAYGNPSPGLECIISLSANDTIEVGTRIEDADATYTINTNGAEIDDDENLLIIEKLIS
jgi:outer membrane murein-binding lipoprotein Lpp